MKLFLKFLFMQILVSTFASGQSLICDNKNTADFDFKLDTSSKYLTHKFIGSPSRNSINDSQKDIEFRLYLFHGRQNRNVYIYQIQSDQDTTRVSKEFFKNIHLNSSTPNYSISGRSAKYKKTENSILINPCNVIEKLRLNKVFTYDGIKQAHSTKHKMIEQQGNCLIEVKLGKKYRAFNFNYHHLQGFLNDFEDNVNDLISFMDDLLMR
ncbi:hypothetical protein SAMN05421827_12540 [Pedobacter terrae]|uniref:Uncharacterized protein n=1 Tax=Pedobacter terrae TaxID=405671 RepID=A0A1G8CLH6_9SPHI|nr:hypothetical protein [Pedobacter terrae]SDH46246.1 hypothetical protein SAMN05421827_12540 [Pedobacter terrae]